MNRSLRFSLLTVLIASLCVEAEAQSVGISNNGAAPNANAMLDINVGSLGLKKGMLIPRMLEAQRLSIAGPADGLLVFQTDNSSGLYYYDATLGAWRRIATGDGWAVLGNASTAFDYVGTSDANDLSLRTNATEAVRMTVGGNVGIGTATPVERLEVDGGIHFDPSGAVNLTNQAGVIRYNTTDNRHEGNVTGTGAGWTKLENAFKEVLGANYQGFTQTCGPGNETDDDYGSAQSAGNFDTPFPSAVGRGSKVQYIFRASELITIGLCAGPVTEIAFRVITDDCQSNGSPPAPVSYNIYARMAHRSLPAPTFAGNNWDVAARTSPARGSVLGLVASSGWFAIDLSGNPFVWDGIQDVIVDISIIRGAQAGCSPPVLLTANAGFVATRIGWHPGGTSGEVFNDAPLNPGTLGTAAGSFLGNNSTRPVIRFTGTALGPVPTLATGDYALYEGGLSVGTPAWAAANFKGPGVIQAENAVYDGSVELSDHVFDQYFDGSARPEDEEKMKDFHWQDLDDLKAFIEENRHLPNMPSREEWESEGTKSLGDLQSRLWETVEMQALYIAELEADLKILEDIAYRNDMSDGELNTLIEKINASKGLTEKQKSGMINSIMEKHSDNLHKASK